MLGWGIRREFFVPGAGMGWIGLPREGSPSREVSMARVDRVWKGDLGLVRSRVDLEKMTARFGVGSVVSRENIPCKKGGWKGTFPSRAGATGKGGMGEK